MPMDLEKMTPKDIVCELDKYIIGQEKAKKAMAVAIRNRFRRNCLPDEIRDEVIPKNVIMIGPTGVGKTEIARRLSKLTGAPFIKVEASKFTEVGYMGRDAESMVRDLIANAVTIVKNELTESVKTEAQRRTEERLLDLLLPKTQTQDASSSQNAIVTESDEAVREKFRTMLREGKLDDRHVEITSQVNPFEGLLGGAVDIIGISDSFDKFSPGGTPAGIGQMFSRSKQRHVTVKQAKDILFLEERDKLVDMETVYEIAKKRTENSGIIFIDEIDKIATSNAKTTSGPDISREGVQRDILPIIEGTTVNTKYGIVDTKHILFIAAGAFHVTKPSDLLPELQGRFPVHVELEEMTADMFEQILTKPRNALIKQYTELLKTEDVHLHFTPEAIRRIACIAAELNSCQENIGTRRLHSVLEALLEDLSFCASDYQGQTVTIDEAYIDDKLSNQRQKHDLKRYIL